METTLFWVITVCLAIIGVLLMRILNEFDDLKKDVKELLTSSAARDEVIDNIKEELDEVKKTVNEHGGRLRNIELKIK